MDLERAELGARERRDDRRRGIDRSPAAGRALRDLARWRRQPAREHGHRAGDIGIGEWLAEQLAAFDRAAVRVDERELDRPQIAQVTERSERAVAQAAIA